ncbi:SLC12A2 [Lepeophtheirus salmonis]|uniref:SLC12A2 n=1 Tax=Lepeophtheirus salmonis TaxID=72036 RepID=A0A7R8D2T1_LEPSM|nr:SLC12A2 [Lepeophtheirus salmonis]CAF3005944.1 SLC12A2 [Lepeophtheirus salmonis]
MEIGNGEKESGSNTGLGGVDNPGFLSVDNADFNSHTYVYDTRRSLSGMTVDALPKESFYQDIKNLHDPANRPTMEELKMGQLAGLDRTPAVDDVEKMRRNNPRVKWSDLDGLKVFSCDVCSTFGVLCFFLRLTWVVGQGGLIQGLGVIALGNLVTVITTLSMSAVSTNGQIRGGGIYYMISRSLGPEFGGAIGIMFTLANSIAVSMYIIGFCQSLLDMCKQYFELEHLIFSDTTNDVRIIGAISLVAVLALAIVGMETQVTHHLSFLSSVFFFPAVTGIVAGANLSGDLKDPGVAIPKGTLLAIIVTFITYIGYGTIITGVMHTEASDRLMIFVNMGIFLSSSFLWGCILIAELDAVSTLLSNFFVAAYALINFSVFHASITKSPGWRPSFKYYNQWVSLFGTFLCFCRYVLNGLENCPCDIHAFNPSTILQNTFKNYRPKVLVFTGLPAHRPPLVDFANLITKKLSLLMCAHVNIGDAPFKNIELLRNTVQMWFRDHKIKSFYSLTQNKNFEEGAIACMNLAGIGKMRPNMVLFGYKGDWLEDPKGLDEYISVLHHAFDLHLGVGILRLESGCDFSKVIGEEEQQQHEIELDEENEDEKNGKQGKSLELQQKKVRTRKVSTAVYTGIDGNPLPKNTVQDITQFQIKKRKGNIDVWWLYDDANRKDELDRETRNMAALLAKFRIDYSDVTVIPDVTKKALDPTKEEFKKILDEIKPPLEESEIISQKEKTNRHLRLTELLREHSKRSEMIIMTLSIPRRGTAVCPTIYELVGNDDQEHASFSY